MLDGLRLSFGTLTLLPVGVPGTVDRRTWRHAMLLAPLVGVVVGALAAALSVTVSARGSALLGAVTAVVVVASATRGLHLDGLADVADALGSRKEPAEARAVMRQSDVGPFGVVSLVLLLLIQVAALATLFDDPAVAAAAVLGASIVSRAAMTWACREGVRAADPTGLGAAVAGTVSRMAAGTVLTASVAAAVAVAAGVTGGAGVGPLLLAAVAALAVSEAWRRHCSRRLGGLTGDVLGATEQVTWTTVVVVLSLA